jgi:PE-PPE domain-containing protein
MRLIVRSLGIALLALLTAVMFALTSTMTNVFTLAATVYILKGTNSPIGQIPDSAYPPFAADYVNAFVPPVGGSAPTPVAASPNGPYVIVPYPATFRPVTPPGYIFSPTFDQSVAQGVQSLQNQPVQPGDFLFGYSQGATVLTIYKRDYNAANANTQPGSIPPPTFVLVANPNRPNGGILERGVALGTIPILGLTFSGATPTTTAGAPTGAVTTYDIARQYDGIADAPTNPLNLVADANAIVGFGLLHGQYPNTDLTGAIYQGQFGDTKYYLIPTTTLPLLMLVALVPVVGPVVATTLDPALRVIVEAGYDRTISPGQPTPFNLLYFPNPTTFGTNLLEAVPIGLDNGLAALGVGRALGTAPVTNPYGVGGPNPDTGTQANTVASISTPTNQQALGNPTPTDTTATDSTPVSTDSLPVSTQVSTPPPLLVSLATKPQLSMIRGPIVNGSSSLPGANAIESSVNAVAKQTTQAITGGINAVASAARSALSGAAAGSPTSKAKAGSTP